MGGRRPDGGDREEPLGPAVRRHRPRGIPAASGRVQVLYLCPGNPELGTGARVGPPALAVGGKGSAARTGASRGRSCQPINRTGGRHLPLDTGGTVTGERPRPALGPTPLRGLQRRAVPQSESLNGE